MAASIAPNTQSVYNNALSAFNEFRHNYNLNVTWPAPQEHITLFIAYHSELGNSPATIISYIAGISFYHKIQNLPDPTASFVIKKLLEGVKRTRKRLDLRAPITESILRKICEVLPQICFSEYEACLFRAAFLLAYFGLLRVSEIVFTNQIQAHRPLLNTDVQLIDESKAVLVSIRISKTNQRGPPSILRIPLSGDPLICCVTAIKHYLHLRPVSAHYFFSHINGSPLTRSQFCGVLAKANRVLRLPSNIYTSHSFRIGRATVLASRGIPNDIIKKLGRWTSDVVHQYIRL